MDMSDTPEYLKTKQHALQLFNEEKAKIQKQEIEGEINSQEAKKRILQKEFEMYQALSIHSGQGLATRIKNIQQMTEIEIEQLDIIREIELANHQTKIELQLEGVKAIGEATEKMTRVGFDNFMRRNDEQKDAVKKRLDDGKISQEQYDRHVEAIERKAFERKKRHEKASATIAYLLELANIAAQAAANPVNKITLGLAGIKQYKVLAAIATARHVANIATIEAQQYALGGMVYGNSHAQGGEKFNVGGRVVELEGGEAVINKKSTAMFRNELSAINVAGGGVSFASGGFLSDFFGGRRLEQKIQESKMKLDMELLAKTIAQNTNVVLPVESLNKVQNRVKAIEDGSKF